MLTCAYLEDADTEGGVALILRKLNPRETRLVAVTAVVLAAVVAMRCAGHVGLSGVLRAGRPRTPGSTRSPASTWSGSMPRRASRRPESGTSSSSAAPPDTRTHAHSRDGGDARARWPTSSRRRRRFPPLPPLNLKFIGSLDNARGLKVAILVTERNEILTGKVGEVVANRYKIGKIGFESVDLEDVTSGQTRRIALRAK